MREGLTERALAIRPIARAICASDLQEIRTMQGERERYGPVGRSTWRRNELTQLMLECKSTLLLEGRKSEHRQGSPRRVAPLERTLTCFVAL